MSDKLLEVVETRQIELADINARTELIHKTLLDEATSINAPNFTRLHTDDLARLFAEYDARFFDGQLRAALGSTPIYFRMSKRMTKAGGKVELFRDQRCGHRWFEISVSTALLWQCFAGDDHRPIKCSGIVCRDRLDALQRVMEHEMIHLAEILLWQQSSCTSRRFQSISYRLFAHTQHGHELITPKERALEKFGIRPGVRVRFDFEGVTYVGIVNRITKRATVLVESSGGEPYDDGKRYKKFYVPLQMLEVVEQQTLKSS